MTTPVPLSRKYKAHDKTFNEVVLRLPTYKEIFMDGLGKPFEFQMTASGPIQVTYPEVIDGYLQQIVIEPGYEYIAGLEPPDAMALERAVCDFFRISTASKRSRTGSSSRPASTQKSSKMPRRQGSSTGESGTPST
ncbi:hypothetical protein [Rhizobium tropici]|uniref:Uncharacterized protein n=1 Tax=Rhizobium tropici TaxID=398 RepID=A0A329YEN6_RHITR|nr:hypothetical protein [Rhizobium tropici]RAX42401.1 hypothetical protein DQ393_06045 [Rhizobium tropici]